MLPCANRIVYLYVIIRYSKVVGCKLSKGQPEVIRHAIRGSSELVKVRSFIYYGLNSSLKTGWREKLAHIDLLLRGDTVVCALALLYCPRRSE